MLGLKGFVAAIMGGLVSYPGAGVGGLVLGPIAQKLAEQILHDDIARIWVDHYNTPLIFGSYVSGYIPQPVGADLYDFVEVTK